MISLALQKFTYIHTPRITAFALWSLLGLSFSAYMYCIVSSVINITLRQELAIEIQDAEAHVSDLESQYLARTNELTQDNVEDAGLVPVEEVHYLSVRDTHERLTRRP